MARSTLKQLAKSAKSRMRNGYFPDEGFGKGNIPSLEREERRVYEKVKNILDSEEPITNPLGLLIDDKVFERLSAPEKERYVLEISKIYIRMAEKYLNDRQKQF